MSDGLRDRYAQRKKREHSRSQFKEKKQAAHIYSLELAAYVQSTTPGPQAADLKESLNDQANFRMVGTATNQKEHRHLDQSIIAKSQSDEKLTKREEARASKAAAFVQNSPTMPEGHRHAAKDLFESLNTGMDQHRPVPRMKEKPAVADAKSRPKAGHKAVSSRPTRERDAHHQL